MVKFIIGAGVAAAVALGYAVFRYEHRCPTPGEIDQIVNSLKANRISAADAENIARELDRRKCPAQAMVVRKAIAANAGAADAAKAAADAKAKADADAAAAASKPKCPAIFLKLPDAPLRRTSKFPGDTPYGVKSIRSFVISSMSLTPEVRDSQAGIVESEGDLWLKDGIPASVFTDAAKCMRGILDPKLSAAPSSASLAVAVTGFDRRRNRFGRHG